METAVWELLLGRLRTVVGMESLTVVVRRYRECICIRGPDLSIPVFRVDAYWKLFCCGGKQYWWIMARILSMRVTLEEEGTPRRSDDSETAVIVANSNEENS